MEPIWHKTYGDAIPKEINPEAYRSIAALIEDSMSTYSDNVAFRSGEATLTYRDVDRLSRAVAGYFQSQLGLKKGDRVALMCPNFLAFPVTMFGLIRAGGVQVNVNPLYTPRELEHQLNDSGAETIIIFAGSAPNLAEIIDKTPIKQVIVIEAADCTGASGTPSQVDARIANAVSFSDVLNRGADLPFEPPSINGYDLLYLQYTGGTTGLSKGAALTHRNLVANIEQFKAFSPDSLRPGQEVVITALPLYHIFALMVNCLSYFSVGADNILIANPRDMDGFVRTIKNSKFSVISGVNTLYAGLMAHPEFPEVDFSNYRTSVGGGTAILEATSNKWHGFTGKHIREGYGLSETSPILTINPSTINKFSGTVGLPIPSTDIKLLKDDDEEATLGEAGEICAKGPQVMQGYWNKPEENANAFTDDGYFRTGDVGIFDEHGFLKIVDRKKDMILVSGFNVYPNEIEAVATAMGGIFECAVIGIPDERTGEAVKLFVVRDPGSEIAEDDIRAYCRENLTAYKVPKTVSFLDALPKSAVGKILRRELRDVA